MKRFFTPLFIVFLLAACGTPATETTPQVVRVQYTFAAQPWLAGVYDCVGETIVFAEPRSADYFDYSSMDMAIRIGQPDVLTTPAYQIGTEEIVIIVNPQNPVATFTAQDARALFSGQIGNWHELGGADLPVQVWVYAAGEDVQWVFDAAVMQGTQVTSTARLAVSPEAMAAGIAADPGAVGFLPLHWMSGNVHVVNLPADLDEALTVPVLAIIPSEPQGAVRGIIACLQR